MSKSYEEKAEEKIDRMINKDKKTWNWCYFCREREGTEVVRFDGDYVFLCPPCEKYSQGGAE